MMGSFQQFDEFLKQFGISHTFDVVKIGRSYFRKGKEEVTKNVVYSGECLAHERRYVVPSIDFLQWIGKHAKWRLEVSAKGEWLFICGRDVFGKSIVSSNNPPVGEIAVVFNLYGECVGFGKIVAPLTDRKMVLTRLFDIGDLLRREHKRGRPK